MNRGHAAKRLGLLGLFAFGGLAGCGGPDDSDEPDWQYDQADMEAAVFGTWQGTITPTDEATAPLVVTIRSHDEAARALACGSRNFSADGATPGLGARCITSSTLAVSATVVGDGSESEEADGYFHVFGETMDGGELELVYRSDDSRWMRAGWSGDDVWTGCEFGALVLGEHGGATCTIDERVDGTE